MGEEGQLKAVYVKRKLVMGEERDANPKIKSGRRNVNGELKPARKDQEQSMECVTNALGARSLKIYSFRLGDLKKTGLTEQNLAQGFKVKFHSE